MHLSDAGWRFSCRTYKGASQLKFQLGGGLEAYNVAPEPWWVVLNTAGSGEFQSGHSEGARHPSSQNCVYRGLTERRETWRPQGTLGTLSLETRVEGGLRYSKGMAKRVLQSMAAPSQCRSSHG